MCPETRDWEGYRSHPTSASGFPVPDRWDRCPETWTLQWALPGRKIQELSERWKALPRSVFTQLVDAHLKRRKPHTIPQDSLWLSCPDPRLSLSPRSPWGSWHSPWQQAVALLIFPQWLPIFLAWLSQQRIQQLQFKSLSSNRPCLALSK